MTLHPPGVDHHSARADRDTTVLTAGYGARRGRTGAAGGVGGGVGEAVGQVRGHNAEEGDSDDAELASVWDGSRHTEVAPVRDGSRHATTFGNKGPVPVQ